MMLLILGTLIPYEVRAANDCNKLINGNANSHQQGTSTKNLVSDLVAKYSSTNKTYDQERHLLNYIDFLPGFAKDLSKLGKDGVWLDNGSGESNPSIELYNPNLKNWILNSHHYFDLYFDGLNSDSEASLLKIGEVPPGERGKTIGLTYYAKNKKLAKSHGVRMLTGRYFQDIPLDEIGKVTLITDFLGVASYSKDLDRVIARYVRLLEKEGGVAHLYFSGKISIVDSAGKNGSPLDWLGHAKIKATEFEYYPGSDFYVLRMEVDQGSHHPLELLVNTYFAEGTPPSRKYLLKSGEYIKDETLNLSRPPKH